MSVCGRIAWSNREKERSNKKDDKKNSKKEREKRNKEKQESEGKNVRRQELQAEKEKTRRRRRTKKEHKDRTMQEAFSFIHGEQLPQHDVSELSVCFLARIHSDSTFI